MTCHAQTTYYESCLNGGGGGGGGKMCVGRRIQALLLFDVSHLHPARSENKPLPEVCLTICVAINM